MYQRHSPYDSRYQPQEGGDRGRSQQNSLGLQGRERSRSPGDNWRGGRPGGGGRNEWRGGRGFGGGGRGGRGRPEHGQVKVQVNYFRLRPISNVDQGEWIQYQVEIHDAMRRYKKNPDGTKVDPVEFEFVPKLVKRKDEDGNVVQVGRTVSLDRGGTSLSRRILMKLQRNLLNENPPRTFMTDGEKQAYAPRRLFTKQQNLLPVETKEVDANERSGTTCGIYGPADTGKPHNRPQAPQTGPFEDFYVRVPKDCEEDDEDVDSAKIAWYAVRLREVGRIGFHVVKESLMPLVDEVGQRESMRQCIEIVLKNQMMLALQSWGKSPRMFYFPEVIQDRIRGSKIKAGQHKSPNVAPFVGITQAVRFCSDNNIYVARDVGTRWFNLDKRNYAPISLLDIRDMTFAGVHIGRFDTMIDDPGLQRRIQEALEKIVFHVKYKAKFNIETEERIVTYHKKLNKSDDDISKIIANRQKKVHHNQRMITTHKEKAPIVWAADDMDLHSFEKKKDNDTEAIWYSVYEYFRSHHGVTLKYPKMPIVLTGAGYCPAELLFQAKSPARGANSPEQCQRVLGFHDDFAGGDKIVHLTKTVAELKLLMKTRTEKMQLETGQQADILDTRQFMFEVEDKPLEVYATLLAEPRLFFRDDQKAGIKNGSWNLTNVKFSRPADLPSFAVLDLAGDFVNILNQLLLRARDHGILTPPCGNFSEMIEKLRIEVKDVNPEELSKGFKKAIDLAKNFFLRDTHNFFAKRNIMFKSLYVAPDGVTTECLLYPLASIMGGGPLGELGVGQKDFGLICRPEKTYVTHLLKLDDGECEARMVVTVKNGLSHEEIDVDPFDFRWSSDSDCHEAKIRGQWTKATFFRYGWKLPSGRVERDPSCISKSLACQASQVECPAVIFINLPNADPGTYHFVKLLSNFVCGGIPSQCIVREKYRNQSRKEQYFSNIALKLNTKLANNFNDACAWEIRGQGLSWVSKVPTLIMGLSMSRGAGKDSLTAVAASALLGEMPGMHMRMAQVLRIQSQPDIVEDHIMRAITKTLTIQFYQHTGKLPKRVLVFRDGSSEGNFQELVEHELVNVRKGIYEVMEKLFKDGVDCAEWRCSDCPGCGTCSCANCAPKITFTVCVNDHNVRVVPDKSSEGRDKNVWSGTCIDREIMPLKWSPALSPDKDKVELYESQDQAHKDFLLTAQHGLKGTSKPVFYRVIVDENRMGDSHMSEGTPLMQSIVYAMSFQYGTATKAVRKVPVVLYSKRLAETAIGFLAYIIGVRRAEGVDPLREVNSAGHDKSWVRKEMEGDEDCDYAIRNELLPGFSPYETPFGGRSIWRTPFRTHLSS